METSGKFNKRAFISTGLLITGFGLPFSGYFNHLLGFDGFTTARHIWMSVHNILGLFFTFFSVWHVIINRKSITIYVKKISSLLISRESFYAISLVLFFLGLAIFHAAH